MPIKIGSNDVVDNNRKGIFQSANVGTFANPARPGSAATGDLIWSTTDNQLQVWNGSAWVAAVGSGQAISASGGSTFTPGNGYKLHIFTGPGTFTLSNGPAQVEYAIIAGGGGGGSLGRVFVQGGFPPSLPGNGPAGGGGSGGFIISSSTFAPGNYSVTIGGGGAGGPASPGPGFAWPTDSGPGSNGGNSSISGPSGTFTATGGGAGGGVDNLNYPGPSRARPGNPGGSGGAGYNSGGGGVPGQGYPGHYVYPTPNVGYSQGSAVGGGAAWPGDPGVPGYVTDLSAGQGQLLDWGIPGSYGTGAQPAIAPLRGGTYFASGGGPLAAPTPTGRRLGGGGIGGAQDLPRINALSNTGSGGGGAKGSTSTFYPYGTFQGSATPAGGNGGSGIVIIRYRTIQ